MFIAASSSCKAVLHDGVIAWLHPKGGTIHPSSKFHQSSHSSVFCPVSSWARLRETKLANHRRFHHTTNPFPENTYYHRQHHSQISFSYIILKPTITTDHLTREQGKEAPLWKVLTHRPRWQWTRGWHQVPWVFQINLSNVNIRRSSYDNGHRADNILLSSANRQTRMEGAEINKSLLALKECIRWAWWQGWPW